MPSRRALPDEDDADVYEARVHRGLEDVAERELTARVRDATVLEIGAGNILFKSDEPLPSLLRLRTVTSLYLVARFEVPRPRALLGDQNLRRLLRHVDQIIGLAPRGSYATLHLSAAGAESAVMRRLAETIASHGGLEVRRGEGDLQIRVRRSIEGSGWDVLIRLTPRPLSARAWRVCDIQGAMNAAVAAAMVLLTEPSPGDRFVNPCCGSGTLLVERAAAGPASRILGADISREALACAEQNIRASGYGSRIETHDWNARRLGLEDDSMDVLCSDLPFGHRMGSHQENRELHDQILHEAARVSAPGARGCFLTHQAGLMDEFIERAGIWTVERRTRVELGGLMPTLFLLRRAT